MAVASGTPMRTCAHCTRPVHKAQAYRYERSGAYAHPRCVSLPNAARMDEALVVKARARVQRAR